MSKIEELKAYVPIMGMIECEDSCGTYLEKDDVVALISNLEKQLAETQTEAAKGKAAIKAMEKIIKLVPVSKDGNEYLTDCDVCMKIVDIIVREAVCQK